MKNYQTQSPVLFLVFNRPDTTEAVFREISLARPPRLYLAADGPRPNRLAEHELCEQTKLLLENIKWDCEVKRLYRDTNLGCRNAVSSAIDWFFEYEEEGIILEDDCLPAPDFFKFCDEMLLKYRFDTRIRHIAGSNHHFGHRWGTESYYFAKQTHVWGWATWKRVWKDYDKTLNLYTDSEAEKYLDSIFQDPFVAAEWKKIFKEVKSGHIDTWDYQLALINFFNNSLSINPNVNLIRNIGFREDGTHTKIEDSPYANMALQEIGLISHPKYILPENEADYAIYRKIFDLDAKWKNKNLLRRRFKRWLRATLKINS